MRDGAHVYVDVIPMRTPIQFREMFRSDVASVLEQLCRENDVRLVRVRHFIKHTQGVLRVPQSLGSPTVVSLHAYYAVCPTVQLLDETAAFSGGICAAGDGPRTPGIRWVSDGVAGLKHGGVCAWRDRLRPYLAAADTIVTTSMLAKHVILTARAELPDHAITMIDHGRHLELLPSRAPAVQGAVRPLNVGNLDVHKGLADVKDRPRQDESGRIDVHVLGTVPRGEGALGTLHGSYARDEFADRVAALGADAIGIFSIWTEAYSHTMSGPWVTGGPTIAVAADSAALCEPVVRLGRIMP
jgi:hypothetical protein